MIHYYKLDDKGNPVAEPNLLDWAKWFDKAKRHVGDEEIGDVRVSTVFLGLDHGFPEDPHNPTLWETLVFGGKLDQEMNRCSGSREQAEAMHARMVERVKESTRVPDAP